MFLSGLKYLRRLERQVKFANNRCCKIKPVAVAVSYKRNLHTYTLMTRIQLFSRKLQLLNHPVVNSNLFVQS